MAMAAVRFVERRLTGQQQQAILRSAFTNEQGVLNRGGSPAYAFRRFTSSEASASNAPKISSQHPSVSEDSRLMEAHQKKKELFDLLTEIQLNKDFPYALRMHDRRLLQRLSLHVDRRPSNPEWRRYSREHAINSCLRASAYILASLYMFEYWSTFFYQNKEVHSSSKVSVSCAKPNIEE